MNFRSTLRNSLCLAAALVVSTVSANAQMTRSRVVQNPESRPTNSQTSPTTVKRTVLSSPTTNPNQSRPTLNQDIVVVGQPKTSQPLVKNTASTRPIAPMTTSANPRLVYSPSFNDRLYTSIQSKLGIPYLYGSMGPNRYDCSSFVWKVFQEAGLGFTRTSARTFWNQFEPVFGDERYKFGTLVFFNNLGHVGIVADENGFYQASSSKGITYSPFKGYWEKRIVGFRRIPADYGMTK